MVRFQGKVVLISGGARGMGAAEARLLAAEGAHVVVGDILEDEGARLAAEIGPACAFVRLDVGESADWARAIAAAENFGGLDGLVNNAGVYQPATLADADLANWERHLRVNQTGVFLGMKHAAPAMKARGGGAIVNLSSTVGIRSAPNAIAYTATKWAVRGMTKAAALEFAKDNIRVNSVHPGPIDTDMLSIRTREDNLRRVQQVPLKRLGLPEEVARLVLYLLSDDAAYITGAEMAIDGGASL
jgi:3alpha(or 20beta)-hydroxysteroid dehydrogenase